MQSRENALKEFEQSVLRVVPINKEPEKAAAKPFRHAEKVGPVFKKAAATAFFDLIKDYFVPDEQLLLKNLLTPGTDPGIPLVVMGKGNQLADAFKQLFEANLIVGCNKAELINWRISLHFAYRDKGAVKNYSEKYLQAIISSNMKDCLSPILDVRKKEGQFFIYPTQKNNRNSKL